MNLHASSTENGMSPKIKTYCDKFDVAFKKYRWGKSECDTFLWYHHRDSVLRDPLMWTIFGDVSDESAQNFKEKDITIVMCGVHGDEITPVKFCFDLMYDLREKYADVKNTQKGGEYFNKVVLVVPLVNPDSFFAKKTSRTNANGIDANRNFPTKDWHSHARKTWINRYASDARRNPGTRPNSEPEVIFQVNLVKRFFPDKIVSVHSPLTLIDYDGPSIVAGNGLDGNKARDLLVQISKDALGYSIKDYPFFPGSLGNWAGQERHIPTYTLELPSSDPSKNAQYWKLFQAPMHRLITHNLRQTELAKDEDKDKNKEL